MSIGLGVSGLLWWLSGERGSLAPVDAREARRVRKLDTRSSSDATGTIAPSGAAASPAAIVAASQVEQIKRDYEELRAKAAVDYAAGGGARHPAALNAFLRQLALLERELWADLAAVLPSTELEAVMRRETAAGQLVQRLLGDTPATEEQRRDVFLLQRAYDLEFALSFDVTQDALLARETARQHLQEAIRGVLGQEVFPRWLRGEGEDFANAIRFAERERLPDSTPMGLWDLKNEFVRRRLELSARRLPMEQARTLQRGLVRDTQVRVVGLLGPAAAAKAQREILGWLPAR